MKDKKIFIGVILGIILLISIYTGITYNSIINKEEKVQLQWNEVQNNYQRRIELLPNLINVVKGGAEYEKSTLKKVTEARAQMLNVAGESSPESYSKLTNAQNELATSVNSLLISVENYPDLKGTQAFIGLQAQLEGTERRIKVARKDFNEAIADYNVLIRKFPTNIVAGLFKFKPKAGFQAGEGTEKVVEIKF